jgi:riboflavin kinase/FMN adenylyltransferase
VTVWPRPDAVPLDLTASVVTVGVFDGVHRGHRVVLSRAAARARELGVPCVAVTFDPHPLQVVRPEVTVTLLSSVPQRCVLLGEAGADAVLVLPFTPGMSRLEPQEFVADVLVRRLHPRAVVVGSDFRFGHRAAGDVTLLAELGLEHGFDVEAVALAGDGGNPWSSSSVRRLLAEGDVEAAAQVLGRPYCLEGEVVHGDHRGRELGYPTANLATAPLAAVPADGVYAGWLVRGDGQRLPAAVSIGTNPTFDGTQRRVEAYVLDRDDLELYGEGVALELTRRLRGTERFDSVDALTAQMAADVQAARAVLA